MPEIGYSAICRRHRRRDGCGDDVKRSALWSRGSRSSNSRIVEYRLARKSSSLGWLFGVVRKNDGHPNIKGLYIYGEVGRGKTMLMDFFFEASPVVRKRRAHFHEFMLDVHERIYALSPGDEARRIIPATIPIQLVADQLIEEAWLLCFDEFHFQPDIADAMILGRLFARLFKGSRRNRRYVQRRRMISTKTDSRGTWLSPFIQMLEEHMDIVRLDARAPTSGSRNSPASRSVCPR